MRVLLQQSKGRRLWGPPSRDTCQEQPEARSNMRVRRRFVDMTWRKDASFALESRFAIMQLGQVPFWLPTTGQMQDPAYTKRT